MAEVLGNGGTSTLASGINNSTTTVTIQSGDSGKFPTGGTFRIAVSDGTNTEIMTVTAGQGTASFTVTRASEAFGAAATAYAFASGSIVIHALTQGGLLGYIQAQAATPGQVKIAEQIISGTTANFTFSSIPQTYKHLLLVTKARHGGSGSFDRLYAAFNSDTGGASSNYSNEELTSQATTTGSTGNFQNTWAWIGACTGGAAVANGFGASSIWIPDYTNSAQIKHFYGTATATQSVSAAPNVFSYAGAWNQTAAITAIYIKPPQNSFVAGCVFTLYGLT